MKSTIDPVLSYIWRSHFFSLVYLRSTSSNLTTFASKTADDKKPKLNVVLHL